MATMFPSDVDLKSAGVNTIDDTLDLSTTTSTLGRSLKFNYDTMEFILEDGKVLEPGKIDSIKQWIELFIRTEVNKYAVYTDSFGVDVKDLLGYRLPRGYQVAEIMRRINEGILAKCPDVVSVSNWEFKDGIFSFTVTTNTGEEVKIIE